MAKEMAKKFMATKLSNDEMKAIKAIMQL